MLQDSNQIIKNNAAMVLSTSLLSVPKRKHQQDLARVISDLAFPRFAAAIQSQPDPKLFPVHPVSSLGILCYRDPAV